MRLNRSELDIHMNGPHNSIILYKIQTNEKTVISDLDQGIYFESNN